MAVSGGGMKGGDPGAGGGLFPLTRWTLVATVNDPAASEDARQEALSQLLRIYSSALGSHLRWKFRLTPHATEDVVQGFVADKILRRNLLAEADRTKGKLRNLLRVSIERYAISVLRRPAERESRNAVALEDAAAEIERCAESRPPSAAESLDLAWAKEVLAQVVERMREDCLKSGREDVWMVFEGRLLGPILNGDPPMDYEELVARFGLKSPMQASNLLVTAKRTYKRMLCAVVEEYAGSRDGTDEEIRALREILVRGGAG